MENKWNWALIDRMVYINLRERPDRDIQIRKELQRLAIPEDKIQRFEAISVSDCRGFKEGTLGCVKSHKAVLEMARQEKWRNVLVLEDDMAFNDHQTLPAAIHAFFNKLDALHWDVAFLAASYFIVNSVDESLLRVKFAYCANSYIVNAHYYDTLIANYAETIQGLEEGTYELGLDSNWIKLMETDRWFGIYPNAGYQRPGKSDIRGGEYDGTSDFTRSMEEMRYYGSY